MKKLTGIGTVHRIDPFLLPNKLPATATFFFCGNQLINGMEDAFQSGYLDICSSQRWSQMKVRAVEVREVSFGVI